MLRENGEAEREATPDAKSYTKKLAVLGLLLLCAGAYILIPALKQQVDKVISIFASGDFRVVQEFVRAYGPYAVLVSFLLMIFQSVAAPLPSFLITFANAALFGWWQGAILSWTSSMVGAALCFYIARVLGRDAVGKLVSAGAVRQVDDFFLKYGKNTILICRLLPFVSFDIVSYAAGLTRMSFAGFLLMTGIGQLPATLVYSYVGGMLTGGARWLMTGLMLLFALSALIVLWRKIYHDRQPVEGDRK